MIRHFSVKSLLAVCVLALLPTQVYAACSNPVGGAGTMIYNTDYNLLQYCNDTNWISMGGSTIGSSSVVGADQQVFYNNQGSAGAATQMLWNKATNRLRVGGTSAPARAVDVTGTASATTLMMKSVTGAAAPLDSSGTAAAITALTGDVTATGPGSVAATIPIDRVTYAKIQNVSANNRLLGRGSSSAGAVEEITLGTSLALSGSTLNVTGAAGDTGYIQLTNGTAFTTSGTTAGQQLFWDNTNKRLGIGNAAPTQKMEVTGNIRASEIISTSATAFRLAHPNNGGYGAMWRNDNVNTYLLLTAAADAYGGWSSLRPFSFANATGNVMLANSKMFIRQSDGFVGIGTTNPLDPLHLRVTSGGLRIDNGSSGISFTAYPYPSVLYNLYHDGSVYRAIGSGPTARMIFNPLGAFSYWTGDTVAKDATTATTIRMMVSTVGVSFGTALAYRPLTLEASVAANNGQMALRNSGATAGNYWEAGVDTSANAFVVYNAAGVGAYITPTTTSWSANSDERLKKNIETLPHALEKLSHIRGVSFHWKDPKKPGKQIGVIAQEVQKEYPEAVDTSEEYLGVSHVTLIGPMIEAVKELKARDEALLAETSDMDKRLQALEAQQ